ncbi:hypothetical protein FA13DRAFT_83953 [Coprinellus micaceus]|uniref:Uncharacterized protein n=1 Tax=Coprinellus micaceus TaxID=71717 RepID=A0A4Y7TKC3_COPMI|nr:hypothetical protein FA13DRAFT_83953 [Coprinellus micaceus]
MAPLKATLAALFPACLSVQSIVATIPVGGLCAGIAGPVQDDCEKGSTCCEVSPDRALCAIVADGKCPDKFIPEGELCAGFAGPLPFPCVPGTKCCYLFPDNAECIPLDKKCPTDWIRSERRR